MLYDLEADRALEKSFLPLAAAREAVTAVMEQFPDMGVDVMVEEGRVYVVQANRYTQAHLRDEEIGCITVSYTHLNKEVSRRLVDFLSGVAYANNGQMKRVANSTFIITPYNVDIMGDLLDELESNGVFF